MTAREMDDNTFDHVADDELRRLEKGIEDFDPDEVEPTLGGDVLSLTLRGGGKIIINRHRAARQIWMAAARQAWHFDLDPADQRWRTEKSREELVATLEKVLSEQLRRPITLPLARRP